MLISMIVQMTSANAITPIIFCQQLLNLTKPTNVLNLSHSVENV